MKRIKTSADLTKGDVGSKIARAVYCFPLGRKDKALKEKWIAAHDLFMAGNGRVLALVDTSDEVFFMDAITGTLYGLGGCQSSSRLSVSGVKRDKVAAADKLLNMRPEENECDA